MRGLKRWLTGRAAIVAVIVLVAFFAGAALVSQGIMPAPFEKALGDEATKEADTGTQVAPAVAGGVQALSAIGGGVPMTQYTVADVADRVSPSVAYIEVHYATVQVASGRRGQPRFSDPFDEFWRYFFFGTPTPPGAEIPPSVGSGVVVSSDGYILTNQHVVDVPSGLKIDKIQVSLPGFDDPLSARLIASDQQLDLAVLKVDSNRPLPAARLGDSDAVRVGEWVVAIGNPFELDHTVTVGVISAKDRAIEIPDDQGGVRPYKHLMQTDAAINPGNSGGPLVNLRGEVVGVNTAVLDASQGQGIGFAIPINAAKEMIGQVTRSGKYVKPWIGISYGPVTDEVRDYFNLDKGVQGVIIGSVTPDSPAAKAGLKPGDIITEVNRQKVVDDESFAKAIADMKVGQKMSFLVLRNGKPQVVTVTVGEWPQEG